MKNYFILFILFLGFISYSYADTTITIMMPDQEAYTFTEEGVDVDLPCCEEVVGYSVSCEGSASWSFPVYWQTGSGSGSFTMSGNSCATIDDILKTILILFF